MNNYLAMKMNKLRIMHTHVDEFHKHNAEQKLANFSK